MDLVNDFPEITLLAVGVFFAMKFALRGRLGGAKKADMLSLGVALLVVSGALLVRVPPTSAEIDAMSSMRDVHTALARHPPHNMNAICREGKGPIGPGGVGRVDRVALDNGVSVDALAIVPSTSASLRLDGWAADRSAHAAARGVCLVLDAAQAEGATVLFGGNRPDVSTLLHEPNVMKSGYTATVPLHNLHLGRHTVQIVVLSRDGSRAILQDARTFILR